MIWPELTTVRRPISDMAREAVRLLLEQVRAKRGGKSHSVEHKLLGFTLVKRESTGPTRRKKP
jgi:LacI family transcriptional regulator